MGLLDDLSGALGGAQGVKFNQLLAIWKWVQEQGGPDRLLEKLRSGGLSSVVDSWLSNSGNKPVSGEEVHAALGEESLKSLADKLGTDIHSAASTVAKMLPMVVDKLSPKGELDTSSPGKSDVGGLLKGFLK
ncbi:hypothetical protein EM595_2913 [Duffyella gerundensis]|uniref:DUF937 domain-containing protein n=1 Tax=Duffyella gerundensis TaxID=1619313 RepID=A0A0U5L725_9GAMM|nr:YidB family protein [Duffyella gerundensis]CUU25144.1 hypothetical protein EM595_2913 [Duffyella gerundensis]